MKKTSKFKKADDMFRAIIKRERGLTCEICGKMQSELRYPLSAFHILPKSTAPRLRYTRLNVLLSCWAPAWYIKCCHNIWHHDRPEQMKQRIAELRGHKTWSGLETELQALHAIMPKLDLRMTEMILKKERDE